MSGSGTDLQQPITSILFNSTQTGLAAGQGLWSTREPLFSFIPMSPPLVATIDHAWEVGDIKPRGRFLNLVLINHVDSQRTLDCPGHQSAEITLHQPLLPGMLLLRLVPQTRWVSLQEIICICGMLRLTP